MITRNFNLYLNAGVSQAPTINVNQYDRDEQWVFTLYNENGAVYVPSTGSIIGLKSDGHVIANAGTVSDGKVVITETEQMTAAAGNGVFELQIDGETHGTANFIVRVEKSPAEGGDYSDSDLSLFQEAIDQAERIAKYGSPLVATSASQMTNHGSVYVYTGSESGYTNGHWYYWNGSAWEDGGVYQAQAVNTDTTLTQSGVAADAKAVGDRFTTDETNITQNATDITDLKNAFEYYNTGFQTFAGLGNFQHYGLNPDGTFMTTQQYRVSNDDAITMEYPITVNVKSGFKWGYIPIYDGTAGAWNGWHTTEQTIPYGVSFILQIAREQENTSEIADVYEFLNAVSFTNKSEYLFTEYESRKTGVVIRDFNSFEHERGQMTPTGENDEGEYNKKRKIRNVSPTYFNKGDVITVSNGMRAYAIGTSIYGAVSSSSGWITDTYTIPYSGFYRLQIGLTSDSEIADKDISKVCGWVTFASNLLSGDNEIYNHFADALTTGRRYEYKGEPLNFNKTTYNITEVLPVLPPKPTGSESVQSTAYYNGVLFLFYNPGMVLLTDYETMDVLATITTGTEHNNCASFSNEFYNDSDEFPLVYLSSDNSNNDIHVTRITRTAASIVRTLRLPVDVAGYHGSNCALDLENNFLWSTGYKINDYQTAENNGIFLCCWDLGNLTDNGNGTYTPALVSKNNIPFINTTQDEKIYNGHLYVVSSNPYVGTSGYTGDTTKIYVISLDGKRISNIISNFNEPIREHETEGIAFIENGNKTVMHVSVLNGRRFDLTF